MPPSIALRPIRDDDWPFLEQLYASTRQDELAQVPWSEAEKHAFVHMQFEAQRRHYAVHFEQASFQVITLAGERVGRLYVDRRADELRIVDIALVPAQRGHGLGGRLLRELLAEAQRSGLCVRIHVERWNPARSLYARLGFRPVAEQGVHILMEWRPTEEKRHAADADV